MLTSSLMKSIINNSMRALLLLFFCVITFFSEIFPQTDVEINFSLPAGFYENAVTVSLSANIPDAAIHLSSDGSDPGSNSFKYTSPFKVSKTMVIKARLFSGDVPVSKTFTATYFINEKITLPVFSISTNPKNFFDPDTGIYVPGPNPGSAYPYFDANFWQDWERPVHIEFFETNKERVIDMDAGIKIFGAWSRALSQKSLALFARKSYGQGKIKHKFFEDRNVDEFESIILRNGGNDWNHTLIRDGMMQGLLSGIDIETQAFRPSVVFINGQYWGIHDIREKINEHFIASYHNVNPDSIDLLEYDGSVISGSNSHYKSLISFISNSDLSNPQNFSYVKLRMDVNNFITYQIAQIYFDNTDWPSNNIKFWRPQRNDGKWRWLLYDTDFGFGLFSNNAVSHNALEFATATNGPSYPNPPWSTLILRKLLNNQEFKDLFISRFSEFSNTIFKADPVIHKIRRLKTVIEPEINRHLQRWGSETYEDWLRKINALEAFAQNRIQYMRIHFSQKFGLNESRLLTINADKPSSGCVKLNAVTITNFPWSGIFYKNIPVKITAVPSQGYMFKEWQGISGVIENTFTFSFPIHLSVSAVFVQDTTPKPDIVINEINYNSAADFDCEDWIELYNRSENEVDISGFILKDENDDNTFIFPAGTKLPGNGYIVACSNDSAFSQFFPEVKNKIGDLGFSISNGGELIRFLDNSLSLIDSVRFSDKEPWPAEPDGSGATLALRNASSDNYLSENWSASLNHGTPGAVNEIASSVITSENFSGVQFELIQNYPNPFNSSTIIHYAFSGWDNVKFRVFDVLGKQVYFEDHGYKTPGFYQINFSADNLPSGIYFYQIVNSTSSDTKMMLLLR